MKHKGIGALAEQIASKGRGGDSTLMHIDPSELAGIAALLGHEVTINPETGLPEAFSWKKLLGAIGLGAAAVFTAGGGLAAILPALSIGTGAGTATTLGALATKIALPALIASATSQAVGSFVPDPNKQNQQSLSAAQKWKEENAKPEYARQRLMSNAYAGVTKPQEQQPQQQPTPPDPTGIVSTLGMSPLLQPNTLNMAEGGELEPEEQKAQKIIRDAMDAIRGEGDDPEAALNTYLAYYGKEALQDLYKRMSGEDEQEREDQDSDEYNPPEGMIKGPGNGMDDMATARMAHGGQKVLLSNDEFIIPADVVSGLGDGSSEAGARKLYAMMDRVRKDRTGTTKQPGKVNDSRVLPA
jgi:hypothetical protein